LAKVLGVVRDNGQAIMAGSDSNENVKIAYSQALFGTIRDWHLFYPSTNFF